jgi:RNA polymerase sigma factor (sigma-70 family)
MYRKCQLPSYKALKLLKQTGEAFTRLATTWTTPDLARDHYFPHARVVRSVNLELLRQGDAAAWDEAFDCLWSTVLAVAQLKLQPFIPAEAEDVAIEALEELVEKVQQVRNIEELKPLAASIAHNRAVSLLRERFAKKRGEGRTIPLDQPRDPSDDESPVKEVAVEPASLDALDQGELAGLLGELQQSLTAESRNLIGDFFLYNLSYQEIAAKYSLAIGSVGVYLKRGLEAVRKAAQRRPKLLKELKMFLR